ncbi:MAG: bifunctional precorrin-2 dehydrogenase/sirohydrochlorin ferrochelatase [PVC group bacterium]|nr:bifunctional precorrin-2 dehydrogenase/sirohydrochlorin ferrochelatase [PVC group bacterium]
MCVFFFWLDFITCSDVGVDYDGGSVKALAICVKGSIFKMNLYPAYLKLQNKQCLVVGGGTVALRKVKSLLDCGAKVTVVCPNLCSSLALMRQKKEFLYKRSRYEKEFLNKMFLVIAATDNHQINSCIAEDACKKNILVNVVDVPNLCDFYVPSVIKKGSLCVAISTQGEFPGLAKEMRKEITLLLQKKARNFKVLAKIRGQIKREFKNIKIRRMLIKELLAPKASDLIENKKINNLDDLKSYVNKSKLKNTS